MKKNPRNAFILVLTTFDSATRAKKIARILVEEKLAACVNILPRMQSIYVWEEKLCETREHLVLLKTRKALYPKLARRLRELHPYEVPEIISVAIESGLPSYFSWILAQTIGKPR